MLITSKSIAAEFDCKSIPNVSYPGAAHNGFVAAYVKVVETTPGVKSMNVKSENRTRYLVICFIYFNFIIITKLLNSDINSDQAK